MKTLLFALPSGALVLAAIPGLANVAYGALARAVGVPRAHLKTAAPSVLEALGMEPGGVSPVCGAENLITVFDLGGVWQIRARGGLDYVRRTIRNWWARATYPR